MTNFDFFAPGGIQMVVHGPPGSDYLLLLDDDPASVDLTFPVTGLTGNFSLATASIVDLNGLFTVPPGQQLGQIGSLGMQTLTSTFSTSPLALSAPFYWQAWVDCPSLSNNSPTIGTAPWCTSNPPFRMTVAPINAPSSTGYTTSPQLPSPGSPAGGITDVEQADIDQDGDLDTFVLYGLGTGILYQTSATTPGSNPSNKTFSNSITLNFPGMTTTNSAEFVDLDRDGFPELVVGGSGTQYITVAQNGGSAAPGVFTVNPLNSTVLQPNPGFNVNDIETADVDGDSFLDVGAATGSPTMPCGGQVNLLLRNTTLTAGNSQLTDVTLTRMPLTPEDTEDMEFFDLEGDGDLDMVMANFDGPAPNTGQNFVYTNVNGFFNAVPRIPVGAPLETLDVVAEDIDLDGLDDLYFGNWLSTPGCGPTFAGPAQDQFFLNTGGAFADQSALLPDSFVYAGPGGTRAPWAAMDAEAVRMPRDQVLAGGITRKDYDHDGDVDIFVALGSFNNPAAGLPNPGTNRGILILQNQQADVGGGPGSPLPPFVIDPSLTVATPALSLTPPDYVDIEFGDWFIPGSSSTQWYEKDLGAGTLNAGHFTLKKNDG